MYTVFLDKDLDRIDYQQDTIDIFVKDCYLNFNLLWKKAIQYPDKQFNITWHHAYLDTPPSNVKISWDIEKHSCIYKTYNKLPTETFGKNIMHTVSSFNGSYHPKRALLCLDLFANSLWHNQYCKKAFIETINVIEKHITVEHNKTLAEKISNKKIKSFFSNENSLDYNQLNRFRHGKNFQVLKPLMDETLINVFTQEPDDRPCPDEKLILPIAAKSLWVAYGCKGYHKFVEQFYGFKLFETIDYSFDSELDDSIRRSKIISQLADMHKLSRDEKTQIHNANTKVIEYNYEHLISGAWITHCKHAWQKYNLTNCTQDHIIEK